ncbi:MAG: CSLREA domain-containing protein, partial [Pseudoalteromonas tetraodonis]
MLLLGVMTASQTFAGTVTTTVDEDNVVPGTGLSLREAIAAAVPGETIDFSPALSGGQTITLGATELVINKNLTIDASALSGGIAISGNNNSRVFNITSGNVSMNSLTVTNGMTTGLGGGILNGGGTLTLEGCTVSDNSASFGGAMSANSRTIIISNSTISGNNSTQWGGGIYFANGTLDLSNSTFFDNTAGGNGGAFSSENSTVTLSSCTLVGNSATSGGGFYGNASSSVIIAGSIVAGNSAPTGPDITNQGTLTPNPVNLIGNLTDSTLVAGPTVLAGAPALAPLADNGGSTLTMLPLPGSPAIDAAGASDPGGTDQRGAPRFRNGALDIGAVEVQPPPVIVTTVQDELDTPSSGGTGISLREAIRDIGLGETITFDAGLDGQPPITLIFGELTISKNLTIDASALASGITISGDETSRVFGVGSVAATLKGINITKGKTTGRGGAIFNSGTLTISHSAIYDNTAGDVGGAILNLGSLTILNSTLTGNTSDGSSGSARGGAIFSFNIGSLTILNSTLTDNTASERGGGLLPQGTTVTLENTIIAGNISPVGADINSFSAVFVSNGVNLIGDNSSVTTAFPAGSPNGNGDIVGTSASPLDPMLSALGYYGGPNQTMHPLIGSPAIDPVGGAPSSSLATDQRGFARVVDGGRTTTGAIVDIGAVEAGSVLEVTNTAGDFFSVGSLRALLNTAHLSPTSAYHL